MTTTTPNMGLVLPDVSVTPGPAWASLLNAEAIVIDAHTHLTGSGVPIVPGAININADLPYNQNNATTLRTIRFFNNPTFSPTGTDLGCLYEVNKELYYRDGVGNAIQLTLNGQINVSATSNTNFLDSAFTLQYFGNTTRTAQFSAVNVPNSTLNTYILPTIFSGTTDTLTSNAATQTLTHKTLTGNTAANLISGTGTFTFNTANSHAVPNSSGNDTVVLAAATQTLLSKTISGASNTITNIPLTTGVTGVLPIANGGTNNGSLGVTAGGVVYANGTQLAETAVGTSGQFLGSNGSSPPAFTSFRVPTQQRITSSTSFVNNSWIFIISTSTTCAVGDTYTNNGNTFTVTYALSAQSGEVFFATSPGSPTGSGTLTRATGSGTTSITFTATVGGYMEYITPTSPVPLYLSVKMVGVGGGGAGSGSAGGTGATGSTTLFGVGLLQANGGVGGVNNSALGGIGGTATITSPAFGSVWQGGGGSGGSTQAGTNYVIGGAGGNGIFGGGGAAAGSSNTNPGGAGVSNTGGGGGGGNGTTAGVFAGAGGGAGGGIAAIIPTPGLKYPCIVFNPFTGGGTAGTGGNSGGAGASSYIEITEHYQ